MDMEFHHTEQMLYVVSPRGFLHWFLLLTQVEALVADGCPKVWVVTSDVLEQQLSHGEVCFCLVITFFCWSLSSTKQSCTSVWTRDLDIVPFMQSSGAFLNSKHQKGFVGSIALLENTRTGLHLWKRSLPSTGSP